MSLFCSSKTFAENKNCRIYKEKILIGCHVKAEQKKKKILKEEREMQSQAQNSENCIIFNLAFKANSTSIKWLVWL